MQRCLQLAQNGLGTTYPNPMVGSIIVHSDKIIGQGWHYQAGQPHAEVHAVQSVKDKSLLATSTIYVTLEPCSHFGKTPPCSDLIIDSGIRNVVIGTVDPNPKVQGKGIDKLFRAGCKVTVGVFEEQCQLLNKRFFTFHQKKRPYVILKWAQTQDGFIAPLSKNEQRPVWINTPLSRQLVHKMRTEEMAILVGTRTVPSDNPSLTARDWKGNHPTRVVLDRNATLSADLAVFSKDAPTICICDYTVKTDTLPAHVRYISIDFSQDTVTQILTVLYKEGIQSVIVEGGAQTLTGFIEASAWDEAVVFTGSTYFGEGLAAPELGRIPFRQTQLDSDQIRYYRND